MTQMSMHHKFQHAQSYVLEARKQITADRSLFNVDAVRVSVPLLVLQESPSLNRLISLILCFLIHSTDGFVLHIARNMKYIHDFKTKIKGIDV